MIVPSRNLQRPEAGTMRAFAVALVLTAWGWGVALAGQVAEPWRNNRIGVSETPPPPFAPVTVKLSRDGARIGCWGRTYTLGATGLPVQVRSQDADLLATPVRLLAESAGRAVAWQSTGMQLSKSTRAQVILEGAAESRIGRLAWTCTAEYDGLLRYDLQITPAPGATVSKLELLFGVKPAHADLMWLPGQYPVARHGRLIPQNGGANWYTWLGDMDRGLAVFFETDEAWDDPNRADAWRLEKHPDGIVDHAWRFIGGAPKALSSPWKYTFGIEATPVKQTPGGRKYLCASHLPVGLGSFIVPWATPKTEKLFGYPEATSPEKFRGLVDFYHRQNIKACPYILLNLISAGAPEFKAHPEWKGDLVVKGKGECADVSWFGDDLYAPVPTQAYIDWIVWKCDRYVRDNNLDGLYHDFTMLMVLTDVEQGFGYTRDGKAVRCYPFFERRELYKRIFTMLKQYRKDAINIGHMSGDMYVPYLSFCDIIVNGEHFGGDYWKGKTIQDLMTDDYIHSEVMGHNYGLTTVMLTNMLNLVPNQDIRGLLGLAVLYDFSLWNGSVAEMRVYKAFRDFKAMDAEFVPFWKTADIVRGQTDQVKCSAYRRQGGGAILAFFNRGKETREMTFSVDWQELRAGNPATARDIFPLGWDELVENPLPVRGDQLTVRMRAEDMMLVSVE
jgi:hypothetical protein